jgi:hypothetical protein
MVERCGRRVISVLQGAAVEHWSKTYVAGRAARSIFNPPARMWSLKRTSCPSKICAACVVVVLGRMRV